LGLELKFGALHVKQTSSSSKRGPLISESDWAFRGKQSYRATGDSALPGFDLTSAIASEGLFNTPATYFSNNTQLNRRWSLIAISFFISYQPLASASSSGCLFVWIVFRLHCLESSCATGWPANRILASSAARTLREQYPHTDGAQGSRKIEASLIFKVTDSNPMVRRQSLGLPE